MKLELLLAGLLPITQRQTNDVIVVVENGSTRLNEDIEPGFACFNLGRSYGID